MNKKAYPAVCLLVFLFVVYIGYKSVIFCYEVYDAYRPKILTLDSTGSVQELLNNSGINISSQEVSLERLHDTYYYTIRENQVLSFQISKSAQNKINLAFRDKKVDPKTSQYELDEIFKGLPATFHEDKNSVSELFLLTTGTSLSPAIHTLAFTTDERVL